MTENRRLYLDNIRWITVLIVVVYHVIYMFNGVQPFGVIGPFHDCQYQDAFQYMVYPWFMFDRMQAVPALVLYLIMAVSGTGVLWYIQVLWILSMLFFLVRKIEKDVLWKLGAKTMRQRL